MPNRYLYSIRFRYLPRSLVNYSHLIMDKLINYLNDHNIIAVISDELLSTTIWEAFILRANINDANEVEHFIMLYQEFTKTQWIRIGQLDNPSRYLRKINFIILLPHGSNFFLFFFRVVFHKYWACQHSKVNKAKDSQTARNTLCDAKIDILI